MSDKELLKTIQNDIKNLDKCIEMCDSDEGIDYLKSIQVNLRKQEIKLVKQMAIKKSTKGATSMNKQKLINEIEKVKFKIPNNEYKQGYNNGLNSAILCVYDMKEPTIINTNTPPHYQGTIQPIDLINAQDLNFNLGSVVKYVCRAGKKQGENILTDLEKAKDYINFEIERVKQ